MIARFYGDYRWLSNFWPVEICVNGVYYRTVEHAYQAAKTLDGDLAEQIRNAATPGLAKKLGKDLPGWAFQRDWNRIRVRVMGELLLLKFKDQELRDKLLATGTNELVEGNDHGDAFWGVCRGKGLNKLGQLLMAVRQFYRAVEGDTVYEVALDDSLRETLASSLQ